MRWSLIPFSKQRRSMICSQRRLPYYLHSQTRLFRPTAAENSYSLWRIIKSTARVAVQWSNALAIFAYVCWLRLGIHHFRSQTNRAGNKGRENATIRQLFMESDAIDNGRAKRMMPAWIVQRQIENFSARRGAQELNYSSRLWPKHESCMGSHNLLLQKKTRIWRFIK